MHYREVGILVLWEIKRAVVVKIGKVATADLEAWPLNVDNHV